MKTNRRDTPQQEQTPNKRPRLGPYTTTLFKTEPLPFTPVITALNTKISIKKEEEEEEQQHHNQSFCSSELIRYIRQYCLADNDCNADIATSMTYQFPPTADLDINYKDLVLGQSSVIQSIVGALSIIESKRLDDSIKLYLAYLGSYSAGIYSSFEQFFGGNSVPTRPRTCPVSVILHLVGAGGLGQARTSNVISNMVTKQCSNTATSESNAVNGDSRIVIDGESSLQPARRSAFKLSLIQTLNNYVSINQRPRMATLPTIPTHHDQEIISKMSTYKPFNTPPYIMLQVNHTATLSVEQCESLKSLSETGRLSFKGNVFELPPTSVLLIVYITESITSSNTGNEMTSNRTHISTTPVQRTLKRKPCQEKASPTKKKFRYTKIKSENTSKYSSSYSPSIGRNNNKTQQGLDNLDLNRALTTFNQILVKCNPETRMIDIAECNATHDHLSIQNTTKTTIEREYSPGGCHYNPLFGENPLAFVPYTHCSLKPIIENALSSILVRSTSNTGRILSWLNLRERLVTSVQSPINLPCFIQEHGLNELVDSVLGYYDNNKRLGVDGLIAFIDQQVYPSLVSLKEDALFRYINGNVKMFPLGFDARRLQDYTLELEITCEKYDSSRAAPLDPSTAIYVSSNTVMSSTTENSKYFRLLRCYSYVSTIVDDRYEDKPVRQGHSTSLRNALVGSRLLYCK